MTSWSRAICSVSETHLGMLERKPSFEAIVIKVGPWQVLQEERAWASRNQEARWGAGEQKMSRRQLGSGVLVDPPTGFLLKTGWGDQVSPGWSGGCNIIE
jgi:hypothetical protein